MPTAPDAPAATGVHQTKIRSLLLVEDDLDVVIAMTRACATDRRLAVISNVNGADVHDCIAAYRPSAVVLDLMLPAACGFDLLREIHRAHPALPIIVLSSHAREPVIDTCLHLGAKVYFVKPSTALGYAHIATMIANAVEAAEG